VFSVDLLRLYSAAPHSVPNLSANTGRVLDPGQIGNTSLTGVHVSLTRPSWIVLGESYDAGWRATCDGRSLGPPRVIDGYANGWLAPAGCSRVAFSFAPQTGVNESYVVSAVACALMLLLLAFGAARAPARESVGRRGRRPGAWQGGPRSLPVAAGIALIAAIQLGYWFALRAGAGLFVLLTFVLWCGYRPRTLIIAAAALLAIAVPALYAIESPHNQGGYGFGFSTQTIIAHWTGVAAIVLLSLALLRIIRAGGPNRNIPPEMAAPDDR
jgi:hypothetical protein